MAEHHHGRVHHRDIGMLEGMHRAGHQGPHDGAAQHNIKTLPSISRLVMALGLEGLGSLDPKRTII